MEFKIDIVIYIEFRAFPICNTTKHLCYEYPIEFAQGKWINEISEIVRCLNY